jgi:GxxExxY protein
MSDETDGEAPEKLSGLADNQITERIIGAAIEVHRHLGPGLLESAYEECLCYELNQMGLQFKRQVRLPVLYKGVRIESAHKMDLLVEDAVVVEIKATEDVAPVHSAQVLTYLKFSGKHVGLLINFNVPVLKDGLKRIVNHYTGPAIALSELSSAAPRFSPRLRVSASNKESA